MKKQGLKRVMKVIGVILLDIIALDWFLSLLLIFPFILVGDLANLWWAGMTGIVLIINFGVLTIAGFLYQLYTN